MQKKVSENAANLLNRGRSSREGVPAGQVAASFEVRKCIQAFFNGSKKQHPMWRSSPTKHLQNVIKNYFVRSRRHSLFAYGSRNNLLTVNQRRGCRRKSA